MPYSRPDALVSTDWLAQHIDAPDVRVVDASWYLPTEDRDPRAEYEAEHIPGAVFFDIDEIADTSNPLPHMLPEPEKFASRARKLGLGDGNRIVVYNGAVSAGAFRAWWMFRTFGHDDVAVLDGGIAKWKAEGRPVSDMPPVPRERHFTARLNTMAVRELGQIQRIVERGNEQIIDARSYGRFHGLEPEPRDGLKGGHIPGSINIPTADLFDPANGTLLPAEEIKEILSEANVDLHKPVTTTCGSGITACVLALALYMLGHRGVAVYDGSWTEWGASARDDLPIAT